MSCICYLLLAFRPGVDEGGAVLVPLRVSNVKRFYGTVLSGKKYRR